MELEPPQLVVVLLCLLSTASLSSPCPSSSYSHVVCVDTDGTDDLTCLTNHRHCCSSLDYVLSGIQGNETFHNSTVVCLSAGQHHLSSSHKFWNISNFTIIGNETAPSTVNINCIKKGAGLSFNRSSHLLLKGFTMFQCGALQMSTSRNVNVSMTEPGYGHKSYLRFNVAVYMIFCLDVKIMNVTWHQSRGTALTLYNSGDVTIKFCQFVESGYSMNDTESGGGGLQIEFTFCLPGDPDYDCAKHNISVIPANYSNKFKYVIMNSNFTKNEAFRGLVKDILKSRNEGRNSFNFGKGGGLSVIFKGTAYHNHISVSNCTFDGNFAHYGGGFYVGYYDDASINRFTLNYSNVTNNANCYINSSKWNTDKTGGGGKIHYGLRVGNLFGRNDAYIIHNNFTANSGISGGGLYISSLVGNPSIPGQIEIRESWFVNNSAFLGSAIYFGQRFLSVTLVFKEAITFLHDCTFKNNTPLCQKLGQSHSYLPCSGIVYSNSFDIHVGGKFEFIDNKESPLVIHSADLLVMSGSHLHFINNTASEGGGGIALYDCSYLTVTNDTHFYFINNTVLNNGGGGIYSGRCNGDDQASLDSSECFVRFFLLYAHPNKWGSYFNFRNNTVNGQLNSVYVTSMEPCWFPESHSIIVNETDIDNAFCWNNWNYNYTGELEEDDEQLDELDAISSGSGDSKNNIDIKLCDQNVKSGIASIMIPQSITQLVPGQLLPEPILHDGKNKSIQRSDRSQLTQLSYCIINGNASFYSTSTDGSRCTSAFDTKTRLFGTKQSNPTRIKVESDDGLLVYFDIEFLRCKMPLQMNQSSCGWMNQSSCVWPSSYFACNKDRCYCDDPVFINTGYQYYCLSNDLHGELYIVDCPSSYADPTWAFQNETCGDVMHSSENNNCVFSGFSSREGFLCSDCSNGYGVPVNSFYLECLDCSSIGKDWLLFLLIQMLPLTLMVFGIIIFNVHLTKGYMYGFVFYCQLMSISFPGWMYPAWLSELSRFLDIDGLYGVGYLSNNLSSITISTFPVSVWNLNFMTLVPASVTPLCLFNQASSLAMISFWYLIAAYPLLLLLFIVVWLSLYDKGFKAIRFVSVPIHRGLARFWRMCAIEPSLTHSIASIYILSYTQFLCTSLKILKWGVKRSLVDPNKANVTVSYFEPSLEYFASLHAAYGALAIIVLIFVVLAPPIFILLYPFSWFHCLMRFFKVKRHLWINHIVDSFNGPFKNRDRTHVFGYQYFPGLYLLIRIPFLCYYYLPESKYELLLELEGITCLLCAGSVMILRPFKKNRHNFINFILFLYMAILSLVCHYLQNYIALLILINIPVAFFLLYLTYALLRIIRHCLRYYKEGKRRAPPTVDSTTVDINEESDPESGDEFPDRLLYPENYSESHSPSPSSTPNVSLNTNYVTAEGSIRQSSRLRQTASYNYGSIQ